MASEYDLIIGTRLDTKGAEQALDNFVRKTSNTRILNFADGSKQLKTLTTYANDAGTTFKRLTTQIQNADGSWQLVNNQITQVNTKFNEFNAATVKTSKTINKIIKDNGDLVTTITAINEKGESITTTITESNNGLGRLTKTTEVYNDTLQKQISMHTDSVNNQIKESQELDKLNKYKQQLTTTTKEEIQAVEREGESYEAVVKTIQEQISADETLTTTITTYKNKLGETVVETEKVNQAGEHVAQTTKTVTKELDKASEGNKKLGNSAKQAAQETKSLGQSLGDAIGRLAKYYVASLPIQMVRKGIQEAITTVKEFDSALIEFQKVSDLAGESLTNYVSKLAEMGELTGSTMQAMVEASTQFRKSGFNDEDSARLASVAEMFRNVADEEISAADSASFIIAQMKAFNIEADKSQHIIDAVNEVSNHFAVSSSDLSNNLGKVSAALAVNGVKYEEMLGMMTAITEVTRNASTASRGLNMISSRLVQTLDDSSSTGKKLVKIYDDLGIALKDENGQMRGTYDILKDLASQWNTLSGDQQKYIALTSAGARQTQNFVALMENFSQAVKATEMAYNSSGSAAKENARVLDSVEKKTEILRSEFQQIVIGKGGLQDFAKGLLDIGISALKLINNLGGLTPVLVTLTTLLVALNTARIVNGFTNIANGIRGLVTGITTGIDAWRSYISVLKNTTTTAFLSEGAVTSLSAAMQASIPIIGAVVAVIGLTVAAIQAHNQKLEEQKQKIRENIEAFADEYKALDNASEKLKNEEITREELNSIIDSNLDEYEAERLKLLDVNEAREKTIELIEAEKKAKAQELIDTGLTAYEESLDRIKNGYEEVRKFRKSLIGDQGRFGGYAEEAGLFNAKGAKEQNEALKEYKNLLIEARRELSKGNKDSEVWKNYTKEIERTEAVMVSMGETWKEDRKVIKDFDNALDATGQHYTDITGEIVEGSKKSAIAIEEERKGREALNKTSKYGIAGLQKLKEQYHITGDAIQKYIEEHQEEAVTTEQAIDALIDEAMELEQVENSIENLDEAYKNTFTTTNDLVSSIDKVSSALKEQKENGSLSLKTQLELIEAGYASVLMYDEQTGACKLNEKALQALIEAKIENHIQDLETLRTKIEEKLYSEANAAIVSANAFLDLAKAKNLANQASLENSVGRGYSASYSGYGNNGGYLLLDDSYVEKTRNQLSSINGEIDALKSNLGKIKSGGIGAFDSVSKGASGAKKATDDLNKSLEETKKKYETVIKWISKQYDKEIDKIKKAEKEALKAEEAKIKAKEKEKDNALDAIEKEIDALEKEKDARKKYWDDQIDALKKQNDAAKDALELQEKLDALEKARNTRVKIYKEGQGFVYDVDQTAVAQAQKELDEYLSEKAYEDELSRLEALRDAEMDNYEQRLDALNDYKDNVQESYEKQIEALNEHKEQLQAQYEAEIEIYENYKQQFEDMVNAYEEEQNRLLAQQLTGIDFENKNWMTRLDNLAAFVNEYNKLQKQLDTGNTSVSNSANLSSGGGLPSSSSNTKNSNKSSTAQYDSRGFKLNEGYTSNNGQVSKVNVAYVPTDVAKQLGGSSGRIYTHANGVGSIGSDQIAIVGENPNQEIVIGSKINNGELMNLGKGTGVVNADSSKTLAGMLNQVGQFGASGFGSGNGTLNNNINNDTLTINGVTIQGANIKDPETFVNGLLNLKAEALQRAYRHR